MMMCLYVRADTRHRIFFLGEKQETTVLALAPGTRCEHGRGRGRPWQDRESGGASKVTHVQQTARREVDLISHFSI